MARLKYQSDANCELTSDDKKLLGKWSYGGYVIDRIKPLACDGADRPESMQWQTVAEGKAKDKWERKGCGK